MNATLPTLGNLALLVGAAAYVAAFFAYSGRDLQDHLPRARAALVVGSLALLVSAGAFLRLIWTRDYLVEYVFSHVSNDLPALYRLSAFWAGQEGSFLIWAVMGAVIAYALTFRAGEWEAPVMRVYLPTMVALILLTWASRPFALIPIAAAAGIPADGAGLNPLLRDPWMAIHPPVTFLGYAALAAPFAFALAGLRRPSNDDWVRLALPWTLIGWLSLGAGIIMGAFWAYKVLGWGGWWGWDPVENASLLPWLTATAMLHGLVLQRSRRKLAKTNVLLAVVTFGLVIYATFLTRSGVLEGASVHTFGQDNVGLWGVGTWMAGTLGYSAFALLRAARTFQPGDGVEEPVWSREVLIILGISVLSLAALLVGLGTSAPIITRLLGMGGAAIDVSYYGRATLPLGVLLSVGIGLSVLLRWKGSVNVSRTAVLSAAAAGLVGMVLAGLGGIRDPLFTLFAGGSVFALVANLVVFERSLTQGGWRVAGAYLTHIGVALMLVAIVAATTSRKQKVDLPYRTPVTAMGYTLTFIQTEPEPEGKQAWLIEIARVGQDAKRILRPRLYQMWGSGQMMTRAEPYILRRPGGDLYVAPAEYLPPAQAMSGMGQMVTLGKGESRELDGTTLTFENYDMGAHGAGGSGMTAAGGVGARVRVRWAGGEETVIPRLIPGGDGHAGMLPLPGTPGAMIRLQGINADAGTVSLLVTDAATQVDGRAIGGLLTVEISEKPLMSLLWIGVLLALLGGAISIWRRAKLLRTP
jgi:cytochrome c-type biogenesis protein CcmF